MAATIDAVLALVPEHPDGLRLTMVGGSSNRLIVTSLGEGGRKVRELGSGLSIWRAFLTAASLHDNSETGTIPLPDDAGTCVVTLHRASGMKDKPWIELQQQK